MSDLLFLNEMMLGNTSRNNNIELEILKANKNENFLKYKHLGKINKPNTDYPYLNNIYDYRYGHKQGLSQDLIGSIYSRPYIIRPPPGEISAFERAMKDPLLNVNRNRDVVVGGSIFKNSELPLPKKKISA